jgi:hypothetical protein
LIFGYFEILDLLEKDHFMPGADDIQPRSLLLSLRKRRRDLQYWAEQLSNIGFQGETSPACSLTSSSSAWNG